jgi:hypothetical protein
MTDAELLQHYIECECIMFSGQRSPGHYRLRVGYIEEHPASLKKLLITVTDAGRAVLDEVRRAA